MKKLLAIFGAVAIAAVIAPMFAAFEAHVVNVTAQIENALQVNTEPINFGTVFPQEELDRTIDMRLSESFMTENRVDDVQYIIRQKPKCGWTNAAGTILYGGTTSGHVDDSGRITCPETTPNPSQDTSAVYGPLPLLCPYLSKHELTEDFNQPEDIDKDGELAAFHEIGSVVNNTWVWNDVVGYLSKDDQDTGDTWNLDLKVPCFGGYCAQDWEDFVFGINPDAVAADYVQDIKDEHKVFGCDVWIEVTGVSQRPT